MFVKNAVNFLSDIFDYYNILCFPYFGVNFTCVSKLLQFWRKSIKEKRLFLFKLNVVSRIVYVVIMQT